MSTDGPTPPQADWRVRSYGTLVFETNTIGSNAIERWVQAVSEVSGCLVDWYWSGGTARILALGDLDKVYRAIRLLKSEHDRLWVERVLTLGPAMVSYAKPENAPQPIWWDDMSKGRSLR